MERQPAIIRRDYSMSDFSNLFSVHVWDELVLSYHSVQGNLRFEIYDLNSSESLLGGLGISCWPTNKPAQRYWGQLIPCKYCELMCDPERGGDDTWELKLYLRRTVSQVPHPIKKFYPRSLTNGSPTSGFRLLDDGSPHTHYRPA